MADSFVLSEAVVEIRTKGIDKLNRDLKKTTDSTKKAAIQTDKLGTKINKSAGGGAKAVDRLDKEFKDTTKQVDRLNDELTETNEKLRDAKGRFIGAGKSAGGFKTEIGGVSGAFGKLRTGGLGALGSLTGGFGKLGAGAAGAVPQIAAVGAALGAIAVAGKGIFESVKAGAKLETSLAEVATISKDVAENMNEFAFKLGDISLRTRTETGLLSAGLYQTISAGITDTSDALTFLETAAQAARAGLADVDVTVDGLTSAVSSFGYEASEVGSVADKFFKTVEVGKLKFGDLASSIGRVAPLASQLGISLDEVLASGAALTTTSGNLSQAITGLASIMRTILKPSSEAQKLAAKLGISFNAAALESKGLAGVLQEVATKTGGSADQIGKLFAEAEALNAVLALTGKQAGSFASNMDALDDASGSTDKAVSILNATLESNIKLFQLQLRRALETLGTELLPMVTEAVKGLSDAMNKVNWEKFRQGVRGVIQTSSFIFRALASPRGAAGAGARYAFNRRFNPPSEANQQVSDATPKQSPEEFYNRQSALLQSFSSPEFNPGMPQQNRKATERVLLKHFFGDDYEGSFQKIKSRPKLGGAPNLSANQNMQTGVARIFSSQRTELNKLHVSLKQTASSMKQYGNITSSALNMTIPAFEHQEGYLDKIDEKLLDATKGFLDLPEAMTPISDKVAEAIQRFRDYQLELEATGKQVGASDQLEKFLSLLQMQGIEIENQRPKITKFTQGWRDALKVMIELQQDLNTEQDAAHQKFLQRYGTAPQLLPGVTGTGNALAPGPAGPTGLQTFGSVLADEAGQLAQSFDLVNSAMRGGEKGGLPGALAAVTVELFSMTKGFGRINERFNETVGMIVTAIEPLAMAIADLLEPLFQALGAVLTAITPLFEAFGSILKIIEPQLRAFAYIVEQLAKVIAVVANAFKGLVDAIGGFLTGIGNKIGGFLRGVGERFGLIDEQPGAGGEQRVRRGGARQQRVRPGGPNPEAAALIEPPPGFLRGQEDPQEQNQIFERDARGEAQFNRLNLRSGIAEAERNRSGGVSISNITGPTRDIFVDLLRPLRQLDQTFPAMLDELKRISALLARGNPQVPAIQTTNPGAPTQRGQIVYQFQNLNITVEQATDLTVEEIDRQLQQELIDNQRAGGQIAAG